MSTQSNGADQAGKIVFEALRDKAKAQGVDVQMQRFAMWELLDTEVREQCSYAAMALTTWLLESPEVWAAFETRKLEKVGGGEQHDG